MRLLFPPLLCAILVSGLSFSAATDSLGRNNFITKIPLLGLAFALSESNAANVWIPEEPAKEVDGGSVKDEYAEVATVFAKPEAKVVVPETVPSEQATPWTSLQQEWKLYQKFHANNNKKDKDADSAENSDEEEDEDIQELPQAFYGQQNSDDDERDFLQKEVKVNKKSKKVVGKIKQEESEEEDEQDDERPTNFFDSLNEEQKKAMIDQLFASTTGESSDVIYPPKQQQPQRDYSEENEDEDILSDYEIEDDDEPESDIESTSSRKKGDDEIQDDDEGHGKGKGKKKKKKKKKKKGKKKGGHGHGWGWKKPIVIPIEPPKEQGWGWKKGLLETLVKGSTWERVLDYYHQKTEESKKDGGWGWGQKEDSKIDWPSTVHANKEKFVDKLFKGSFWERAFKTYAQYKNNKQPHPAKEYSGGDSPIQIDW